MRFQRRPMRVESFKSKQKFKDLYTWYMAHSKAKSRTYCWLDFKSMGKYWPRTYCSCFQKVSYKSCSGCNRGRSDVQAVYASRNGARWRSVRKFWRHLGWQVNDSIFFFTLVSWRDLWINYILAIKSFIIGT